MRTKLVMLLAMLTCAAPVFAASTYYVRPDGDDSALGTSWSSALLTVTNALGKAGGGDEIWVAAGTYSPGSGTAASFDLKSSVALYGGFTNGGSMADRNWTNNPTILDGGGTSWHVVKCLSKTDVVLDGFTIKGGYAAGTDWATFGPYGGGILLDRSSFTLNNCIITGNVANASGVGGLGGGLGVPNDANGVISNCSFVGNSTGSGGNWAGGGAALYLLEGGSVAFKSCVFRGNSSYTGGGIGIWGAGASFADCDFIGNTAGQYAGGVSLSWDWVSYSCTTPFVDCTFVSNSAASQLGGGLAVVYHTARLVNCSFSRNSAVRGGAVSANASAPGSLILTNCILWGNSATVSDPEIYVDSGSVTVDYSDVQGGWAGTGNLNVDPLFADPSSDLHLKSMAGRWNSGGWVTDSAQSPCIDAGDPSMAYAQEPAPNGSRINMGAYGGTEQASKSMPVLSVAASKGTYADKVAVTWGTDINATGYQLWRNTASDFPSATNIWSGTGNSYDDFSAGQANISYYWVRGTNSGGVTSSGFDSGYRLAVYHVRQDGSDSADGLSWATAFATLTHALANPSAVQIWVAAGTYSPGPSASDSFNMKDGVSIYGGFTNGGSMSDRNWSVNATILDGADNNYHVVKAVNAGSFVVDGFTVTRGNASVNANGYGGGFYISGSAPMIYNCTIATNKSTNGGGNGSIGGGMVVLGVTASNAIVSNCVFVGNSILNIGNAGGAALYVESGLTFKYCVFRENLGGPGGGIMVAVGSPTFYRCDFIGNTAPSFNGGGALIGWGGWPTFLNCTFTGNSAVYGGAIDLYQNSTATVVNCSFAANTATAGGAVNVEYYTSGGQYSSVFITNSIFWGDTSPGIKIDASGPTATVSYSDYESISGSFAGSSNLTVDPLFANAPSDLHLKSKYGRWTPGGWVTDAQSSPCIDAGDPAMAFSLEPAANGGRINMGAYGNTPQASKSYRTSGLLIHLR